MSIVLMGSTSGSVTLAEPAIAGSTVLDLPATSGTVGLTTSQIGMKNRIINGGMVIDQRNAGASVSTTAVATTVYTLDRWFYVVSQASKFTIQQNAGSVTPPAGFNNYIGCTSSSAHSIIGTDYFIIGQRIEGFNFADLGWGTANAATITLSFWVRSSLTGTFGGALRNGNDNRSYPFSYTISAANTWEQKSVTIAGDTSGTWAGATNGIGVQLFLGLGVGASFSGTAGSWQAANLASATGATSVVGTNGATFYITGVQLELGSAATTFDFRAYGTELALCQRYFNFCDQGYFPNSVGMMQFFKVTMRAVPTVTWAGSGGFIGSQTIDSFGASSSSNQTAKWTASAEL